MSRALTEKQLFALDCVDKQRIEMRTKKIPGKYSRPVRWYWAIDTDITCQIRSLKKRRLIRWTSHDGNGRLVPTKEGDLELAMWRELCNGTTRPVS